jgi:hypothetical protein
MSAQCPTHGAGPRHTHHDGTDAGVQERRRIVDGHRLLQEPLLVHAGRRCIRVDWHTRQTVQPTRLGHAHTHTHTHTHERGTRAACKMGPCTDIIVCWRTSTRRASRPSRATKHVTCSKKSTNTATAEYAANELTAGMLTTAPRAKATVSAHADSVMEGPTSDMVAAMRSSTGITYPAHVT